MNFKYEQNVKFIWIKYEQKYMNKLWTICEQKYMNKLWEKCEQNKNASFRLKTCIFFYLWIFY